MSMRVHYFFILVVCGCISLKAQFRPYLFADLPKPKNCVHHEEKIKIDAQYMSQQGCKKYFGLDLVKKGYRPLLMTVTNLSKDSFLFKQDGIKVESVDCKELMRSLYSSQIPATMLLALRLITMGHLSLVGGSALAVALLYNHLFTDALSYHALDKYADYGLAPGMQITFFIFVPEKLCKNTFDFCYKNATTKLLERVEIDTIPAMDSHIFLKPACLMFN